MQFNSVHSALSFAYKQVEHLVMPKNNTMTVMQFMESKGVIGGCGAGMTQHDTLAQAAMIISKVDAALEQYPLLLAAIRCQYGRGGRDNWHKGVMLLDAHYRAKYNEAKCDGYGYVIRSIFMAHPNKSDLESGMLKAFDWSYKTWKRRKSDIRKDMGQWVDDAICILETVFEANKLIIKEAA